MEASPIKLFSGTATKYLAEKIADSYGTTLGRSAIQRFADGEFQATYEETVRGTHAFIIQSTFQPSDNLLELLMMIDAAKRASAYKVIAVMPYFGFARQDRKDRPRVSIGAKLVADLLTTAGISRVITMDLHADQIQGFFNLPVDHLYASSVFVPYLRSQNIENLTIAAPDMGGSKRAGAYSQYLGTPMAIGYKHRAKANVVDTLKIIGEVKDRNVVIVDDMVDTAGTITKAAQVIMDMGAASVRVMATHPILSGPAYERLMDAPITEFITTDTVPLAHPECEKIKVLSVADLFANTIKSVYNQRSISSNFIF
ncbi:MAG: ribose-phosphate pyrophosphokinase [Salinivirgaceae bacterium]|nr:ribose-phosphate pyrophosphokinase [Salinivirgaceae bacterium]